MAVITRVYDTFDEATKVAAAINGLGLPEVQASVAGDERLRKRFDDGYGATTATTTDAPTDGMTTGAGIGAAAGGGAGLLAGLGVLAIPGLGPVVAAGWLAATALGAAGGALAGGTIGALAELGLDEDEAEVYAETLRRGGVLVSIRFPDSRREQVMSVLDRSVQPSLDVRRRLYEAEGWRADETEDERRDRLVRDGFMSPLP